MPRCKQCKTKTDDNKVIYTGVYRFCSNECRKQFGIEHAKKLAEKAKIDRVKKVQKERAEKKRKFKANDKTLRKREAQKAFNAYIRKRDEKEPCISCQRHHDGQYHAGHYKTTGANPELRFNEDNCHKKCAPCNNHLSGNIANYRINLINKIGQDRVDALESKHDQVKYSCEDLKEIETRYKQKLKLLQ